MTCNNNSNSYTESELDEVVMTELFLLLFNFCYKKLKYEMNFLII